MELMKSYKKAKIKVFKEVGSEEITVHFNPSEYQLTDSANYSEKNIPGLDGPITQYISGAATQLSMSLVFDSYDSLYENTRINASAAAVSVGVPFFNSPEDVSKITKKIIKLTEIDGKLHRPPLCQFIWGSLKFKGVITDVQASYTMFLPDGKPVRAKLDVTFQSVIDPVKAKKESPFESPDRSKYRVIKEGMQLWHIADQEYGDPGMWRVIAKENGIMNPKEIYSGQSIRLPAL